MVVLVVTSAAPTLAHFIAVGSSVVAKATPKPVQRFLNRHIESLVGNEDKILSQLGNAVGGVAASIAAAVNVLSALLSSGQ